MKKAKEDWIEDQCINIDKDFTTGSSKGPSSSSRKPVNPISMLCQTPPETSSATFVNR
ncbi:hypothetical protein DPMN_036962 [Dreissena polymorpha]|uniref:Uncharacterized protein n=1 Tax=Dreissena polymorpha TaxID=45954 RepID=A0A9D4MAE1_DREPO|nr:hypothetical protein DPMN_036962 [Dreissena polymorpha]